MLRFLQAHDTEYLSGQDLSDVLKISRVAVWKHVKKIRQLGYDVSSRQRTGYRLASGSDAVLPWDVTAGLPTREIGQRAYFYDSIDSTQSQAQRMAGDPANYGAVIVAARQTGGKGRSGRRWISPKGGIWLSVILRPDMAITDAALLPIASSVALARSVEQTCGTSPELRWPNDLTVGGKKVAGILVDASLESSRITSLVLGAGINYDVDPKQIRKALGGGGGGGSDGKTTRFYGAATLDGRRRGIRPVLLVRRFLVELEEAYDRLISQDTGRIISEWTARSSTIGRTVRVDTGSGTVAGKAVRIDADGALVVSSGRGGNRIHTRVVAGDIIGSGGGGGGDGGGSSPSE